MIGRIRRSFPLKLVLASVFVLLVVGAYVGLAAAETTSDVQAAATDTLEQDAGQAAATTSVWLSGVSQTLDRIAQAEAIEAGDYGSYFEAVESTPPGVVAFGYLDSSGELTATTTGDSGVSLPAQARSSSPSKPFDVPFAESSVVALTRDVDGGGQVVALLDLQALTERLGAHVDDVVVTDADRTILYSPSRSKIGQTHPEAGGRIDSLASASSGTDVMNMERQLMSFGAVEGADWVVMVHQDKAAAFAIADQVQSELLGAIFMGMVGLVVIGATVGSSMVITLRQLTTRAEQMADGNLSVPLETRRDDEFGRLYGSLSEMRDSLRERIEATEQAREEAETAKERAESAREEAERERREAQAYTEQLQETATEYAAVMQAAAEGDLTQRLDTEGRSDVMQEVGREFNTMLGEIQETTQAVVAFAEDVSQTAADVQQRADQMATASQAASDAIDDIQHGAREQDESLDDVSREIESLSASAEEIAATTDDVARVSQQTAAAAEEGEAAATDALSEMDDVVDSTTAAAAAIEELDDEMERIVDIVDVIQNIAEETNMLALNASIEAARAGGGDGADDGQGFAVVADEVKSLSEETKDSADKIEARISSVQEQTGQAVETVTTAREQVQETATTVEDALTSLETIAERVEENDTSIQEINDVTSDQAHSAQRASDRVASVADISQRTVEQADEVATRADTQSTAVSEVREAISDLSGRAESLQQLLDQFTVAGADFETTGGHGQASADGGTDGGEL